MWQVKLDQPSESVTHHQFQTAAGKILTFREAVELWSSVDTIGQMFRLFTSLSVASSMFSAFRFETPAVTSDTFDREFEFVLLNSPELDRRENAQPFSSQFNLPAEKSLGVELSTTGTTISFPNLGKNALLIAPRPTDQADVNHCHLGSYLRTADQSAGMDLWWMIGHAMQQRVNKRPVWLNTAGGGVAWLHVRLDDKPKYYLYAPFKTNPSTE